MSTGVNAPSAAPVASVAHAWTNPSPPSYVLVKLWGTADQLLSYSNAELGAAVAQAIGQHRIDEEAQRLQEYEDDIPY